MLHDNNNLFQVHNPIEDIYIKYHKSMLYAAYRILGSYDQAEDAVQNAFVKIIKCADRVTPIPSDELKAFVIIVSKNCAKRLYSETKRNEAAYLDDLIEEPISRSSTEDAVLSIPSLSPMFQLINLLSDSYRDLVVLKYYYDLMDRDIAKLLNLSEVNVRVRLHRAKAVLRELYEKECAANEKAECNR
ncbi:MAG: RNA polymerase sigma factor [Acetanaerobacterium sp.]